MKGSVDMGESKKSYSFSVFDEASNIIDCRSRGSGKNTEFKKYIKELGDRVVNTIISPPTIYNIEEPNYKPPESKTESWQQVLRRFPHPQDEGFDVDDTALMKAIGEMDYMGGRVPGKKFRYYEKSPD